MPSTFRRREMKYIITKGQKELLDILIQDNMEPDEHHKYTVCNLYYDTPDYLLIRRSIDKPDYKEKLRLRSYGIAKDNDTVFLEIKKKFKRIVYKRRVQLQAKDVEGFFDQQHHCDNNTENEITYFKVKYGKLQPRVKLSYDREAYQGKVNKEFRLTFDSNILWRTTDLSLDSQLYGNELLAEDTYIMEVKSNLGLPLWLVEFLSANKVYKTSYSKYGQAYIQMINKGVINNVG